MLSLTPRDFLVIKLKICSVKFVNSKTFRFQNRIKLKTILIKNALCAFFDRFKLATLVPSHFSSVGEHLSAEKEKRSFKVNFKFTTRTWPANGVEIDTFN